MDGKSCARHSHLSKDAFLRRIACSCSRITLISDAMRNYLTKRDVRQSSGFYPAYSGQMSNSYSPAGKHDASHLWRPILNYQPAYRCRPRISARLCLQTETTCDVRHFPRRISSFQSSQDPVTRLLG